MIGIQDISCFFGNKKVYTKELLENADLDEKEFSYFETVGVETVWDAVEYSAFDLAKEAALKLMSRNYIEGNDIDLIIYIQNRLPEYFMSSSASRLQHELNAKRANAFSISDLGCTDMTMAIKLAKDYLLTNPKAEVVLISYGNKPYSPSRFRFPVTINGDGGVAVMVSRTQKNQIMDIEIETDGKYWDLFKVEYLNKKYSEYKETCTSSRKYGFELAIESKLHFTEINNRILKRNGLSTRDIQHFILQNISNRAYEVYEMSFDFKFSKICSYNLSKYGHLGPADVMVNYLTGLEKGVFTAGDKVLIMNNSPVASWSSILLQV